MKHFFICIALCWALGNTQAQTYQNNAIHIKFNRDFFEQEIQTQRVVKKSKDGQFKTNIPAVDKISKNTSTISLKPVFIADPRFAERHKKFDLDLFYEITFSDTIELNAILEAYQNSGIVEVAERIPVFTPELDMVNDPFFNQQWGLKNPNMSGFDIDAEGAWNSGIFGDSRVVVAIIDNSVDINHPDIAPNLWRNPGEIPDNGIDDDNNGYVDDVYGWNFVDRSPNVYAQNVVENHGTHVAGIVAARTNNRVGVSGIAGGWGNQKGTSLMCFRAGWNENIEFGYQAMVYAADNGAAIAQCSWGGPSSTAVGDSSVRYFTQYGGGDVMRGGLIIAAAGNSNTQTRSYPAGYSGVLAVGSITNTGARSSFSNYGSWVGICAPGTDIYSALPENNYGRLSGTSMACPHVSGVAALVLAATIHVPRSQKTPAWLADILINTGRSITTDQPIGPLVNAKAAIDYVINLYGPPPASISAISEFQMLDIYPNPTQGLVNIQLPEGIEIVQRVDIFDILGQLVKTLQGHHESIDLNNLATGLYIIKISTEKRVFFERIIKY